MVVQVGIVVVGGGQRRGVAVGGEVVDIAGVVLVVRVRGVGEGLGVVVAVAVIVSVEGTGVVVVLEVVALTGAAAVLVILKYICLQLQYELCFSPTQPRTLCTRCSAECVSTALSWFH